MNAYSNNTRIYVLGALIALLPGLVSAQLPSRNSGKNAPNQSKTWQLAQAKKMDLLVGRGFKRTGIRPMPKTTDEQFLRRTYLNIAGRIPTYDEAMKFLGDEAADKRSKLVDELLDSDAYTSHMFNWWADLLRASDNFSQTSGAPYIHWIKDSIAKNKPYDKMVYELLTASGGGWEVERRRWLLRPRQGNAVGQHGEHHAHFPRHPH